MGSQTAAGQATEHSSCCDRSFEVFALLGKRWNGLLVSVLLNGPARFAELERAIEGIRAPMLSRRLTELAETGLVEREVTPGPPVSVRYRLTERGEGLRPAIVELQEWGRIHFGGSHDGGPAEPPETGAGAAP